MRHIITHHYPRTPVQHQFFELTRAFNAAVAKKLEWEFHADELRRVPNLNIWREKAAIICEVLEKVPDGDEALWIDGDVLLVGDRLPDIFSAIGSDDFGMSKLYGRWNSGVVPMKVNAAIRELWKEMRDHEHQDLKPIINELARQNVEELLIDAGVKKLPITCRSEEWAVPERMWSANECANCPWPPEKRGPLCGSYKVKLAFLEKKWNEMPTEVNDQTQIIGFHHFDAFTKLRLIKMALEVRNAH